ncbi:hypothetical protein DET65_4095 [Sunxiuqinia elliptica]|uniref:Uncharacterized protein n=2 Tax=Sunxiuqinia elliptica TaxID=655355 RepID=A0A4R6GUG9_9BACT|nr:hypothetical protein DET52_107231 [Sunxiuqinia elliptica]TDO56539.1 hypothetical protein DET65_4095 [Sunxiuqinia elliptica]
MNMTKAYPTKQNLFQKLGSLKAPHLLLIFLVLTASCTVRHSVQHLLDVPLSETLNPNKTSLNQANSCVDYAQDQATKKIAQATFSFDSLEGDFTATINQPITSQNFNRVAEDERKSGKSLSLYILYRKMKILS